MKKMEKKEPKIIIKKAEKLHSRFLWECRNEETSRRMFENTKKVKWREHEQWMERSLLNEKCYLYIGITKVDIPFGLVRFDKIESDNERYTISINLAKEWRQKGLAKKLLGKASKKITEEMKENVVLIARIKKQNTASIGLFKSSGYKEVQEYSCEYKRYETTIKYIQ